MQRGQLRGGARRRNATSRYALRVLIWVAESAVRGSNANCSDGPTVCAIESLSEVIESGTWPEFWLTLVATLVGATAAFIFSWLLTRRDWARRYQDRVDEHVVKISESIAAIAQSLNAEPGSHIVKHHWWSRHQVIEGSTSRLLVQPRLSELLMLTSTLELVCRGHDAAVAQSLRSRILEWGRLRRNGRAILEHAGRFQVTALDTNRILTAWRRGDIDASTAILWLDRRTSPVDDDPDFSALRRKWEQVAQPQVPRRIRKLLRARTE
ncbi:hypothetical protein MMM2322_01660 [Microbacterium sp. MM2322]